MTAAPPRRIQKIEVNVEIPLADSDSARDTLEEAALTCPVALSLHPDVEKLITFVWTR